MSELRKPNGDYTEAGLRYPGMKADIDFGFVRIGNIPNDQKSNIYHRGDVVGQEKGVSAWHSVRINGKWQIAIPNPCTESTVDSIHGCLLEAIVSGQPVYLVSGEIVGYGSDGEPLLKNVVVLEDINDNFSYLRS